MKYNYRSSAYEHFNNMRSYFLGDEAALLMASYPYDRPESPFSYFSEVMTGFEYTAAIVISLFFIRDFPEIIPSVDEIKGG